MAKSVFHIADYVIFAVTVLISIGIGIFYALSGGGQKTTTDYLVGGRKMTFLPVAISLMVSFESSIMMLGLPAEIYCYGMEWMWYTVGVFVAQMLTVHTIVPLLHPLKLTSAYEYLELRFQSKWVRRLGTLLGMLHYVWYMGIVLFGPAVALEAVTGVPLWSSVVVISTVAVIYTSIGGLKAVIWTDVFQAGVMFMGMFAILIKGTIDSGGPKRVVDIANEGGRFKMFNFDPDPRIRHTFWNLFFGSVFRGFGLGFNQSTIQRISSTKSASEAQKVMALVAPMTFTTLFVACYEGVVAFAYYTTIGCDPLGSGALKDPNQLIPYVVLDLFHDQQGMPGLFIASLFSASLSTLSSGLASLAALLWADVVHPLTGDISDATATVIAKVSVVVFGAMACGIAFLVAQIGGTLVQIATSILSAFIGPLVGLFFLGGFCPRANAKGAVLGGIVSLLVCMWISLGQNFSPLVKKTPFLPLPATDRCDVTGNSSDLLYSMTWTTVGMDNLTTSTTTPFVMTTAESLADDGPQGIEQMYSMSYQWLATVGIVLTLVVGMLGSLCTGLNKPGDVDPRYLISVVDTFLIFLPPSLKRWLSGLGTQFMDEKYKARFPDPQEKKNIMMMDIEVQPPPGDDVTDALMPNGDKTTYFDDVTDALMPNGDKTAYFDDVKESEVISHTGGNATNNDDVIVINNAAPLSSDSAKKSE